MHPNEWGISKDSDINHTSSDISFNATEKHNSSSHFETVIVDLESISTLLPSIQEAIKAGHIEHATKLANIGQKLTEGLIKQSNEQLDILTTMS